MRRTFVATMVVSMLGLVGCACCKPAEDAKAVYGPTNPEPASFKNVQYYGSVIELRPEKEQVYRELHAAVWPEVVAAIRKANIKNYNIFVAEIGGKRYLFSFLEHHGPDPKVDFAGIAKDETTRTKWWPVTDACQRRIPGTPEGEQWMGLEMLMHIE